MAKVNPEERLEKMLDEHPELRRLLLETREFLETHRFLGDVRNKMVKNGKLSPAQIAAVKRQYERIAQREQWKEERQQKAALLASQGIKAPQGRCQVEGTIVGSKEHADEFGVKTKVVVRSDEGWSAWVTLPDPLAAQGNPKGRRVRLTATLERSNDDPAFAFGKRPSKAEFLENPTQNQDPA